MRKKKEDKVQHFCREYAHATDFHSMNLKGQPILAKCHIKNGAFFSTGIAANTLK